MFILCCQTLPVARLSVEVVREARAEIRSMPVSGQSKKEVAAGSAFTRPCGAWPCGVSTMWPQRRVRAVPCLHLSRAGGDARVKCTRRSPGPSFPSAVIFRSFTRSDFAVSPSNSRQPCSSGCGFPCALCIPALSPCFYGGTAPPGVAEYVNNGGKHHAVCEICHPER